MDNATLITAIMATVDAYIDARIKKALEDHSPEIDMDNLRELVAPIVESQIEAQIEQAFDAHQFDYDHDDFIAKSDLESEVCDVIKNEISFTVRVD